MIKYSIVVPVYNRPDEVDELLQSLVDQSFKDFEVIVVDDGSSATCEDVVDRYRAALDISYYFKHNEGPGPTRNYGADKANGQWLIFLDSDCFLPSQYFAKIETFLVKNDQVRAFGGPDRDHMSFSSIQKAISFSMTSFLTTGGIRGSKKSMEKFKPRSFNMGIYHEIFTQIGGFGKLRFGEDMDVSLRILNENYLTALIPDAFVYHKRRSTFRQFHKQVFNSGMARIILAELHPGTMNIVHLFPSLFLIGNISLLFLAVLFPEILLLILIYPFALFFMAYMKFKKIKDSINAVIAAYVQLASYGLGFLKALIVKKVLRRPIKHAYLDSFYK